MTDRQIIRNEIARINAYTQSDILTGLIAFIDSMQEEPASEDYDNALHSEALTFLQEQQIAPNLYADIIIRAVKHGAKWQKEQMMKDAVDAECDVILLEEGDELQYSVLYPKGKKPFNKGDKVKLIIIKED